MSTGLKINFFSFLFQFLFSCGIVFKDFMNHFYGFLENIALVLGVAALATIIFHKLKQPVILGYLIAGMIIGPYVPIPILADSVIVHELAELGVILLVFFIGLEFNLRKLAKNFLKISFIALFQCGLLVLLGYGVGRLLGWTSIESLYTGALISISSTTIIAKVFEDRNISGERADLVYGILIIEDLIAILFLATLPLIGQGHALSATGFLLTIGKLALFLAATLLSGVLVVPWLVKFIITLKKPEITIISSLGLCFGMAILAFKFGYSVALGSFLAGALVAESKQEKYIEMLAKPVRDIFAAVFFVAIGMLINPSSLLEYWKAILILTGVVIFGKWVSVYLGSRMAGLDKKIAFQAGMSLAQIGEFSFIIAGIGFSSKATGDFLYPIAIAISALTTLTTPWLIRFSEKK